MSLELVILFWFKREMRLFRPVLELGCEQLLWLARAWLLQRLRTKLGAADRGNGIVRSGWFARMFLFGL